MVIPKIDHDEVEYLHIYIVFDGDFDLLETRWTGTLYDRISPRLLEMGIMSYTSESYVEKSEWEELGERILKRAETKVVLGEPRSPDENGRSATMTTTLPWISLLYRWPPSDDVLREAGELVKNDLEGHFGDTFVFDPIVVIPKIDHDGDEYLHIYIVFDGDFDLLEIDWTGRLYTRIKSRLREMGIMGLTSESYVEKSEWEELGERILKKAETKVVL